MDEKKLKAALRDIPLGGLRFYPQTGSTNDVALAWATEGASDLSLVVADEQTHGRGRSGNTWYTPARSALAFSLILRPQPNELQTPSLITGLGALALVDVLKKLDLAAQIKWPNDVLVNGHKVAGILVETVWLGDNVESLVLGMGVNVLRESVPPAKMLAFPATSLEEALGHPLKRSDVLKSLLTALLDWRPRLDSDDFVQAWESALAFQGETVQVWTGSGVPLEGQISGLETDGSLRVQTEAGESETIRFGEVHLRPSSL